MKKYININTDITDPIELLDWYITNYNVQWESWRKSFYANGDTIEIAATITDSDGNELELYIEESEENV